MLLNRAFYTCCEISWGTIHCWSPNHNPKVGDHSPPGPYGCCAYVSAQLGTVLSAMLRMLLVLLLMLPLSEAVMCYNCIHCNDIPRTWSHVNCSGSCVKSELTHKLAKPTEASVYTLSTPCFI